MNLSKLERIKGNKRSKLRVGRGYGSGKGGHTVGKGTKGQKSRTGKNIPIGFEGGQVPLFRRLPQIGGFKNLYTKKYSIVPLVKLNVFDDGAVVTPQDLVAKKILKKVSKYGVKILNTGKLAKKIELQGFVASKAAIDSIKESGSTFVE